MSNATKTAKRSDFKKYFQFMWRSLNIQASWNYERQMNMGFLYGIAPTLDELYPDENDPEQLAHKKEAYEREMAFYNCTPQTSAFTLGLAASMEEQYAADRENFNPETINAVKTSLMGPLSGVGDSFFQGTVRLIAFGLGISLAQQGSILGPILAMVISIVPTVLVTWFAGKLGYTMGSKYLTKLNGGMMDKLMYVCGIVGLMVIGAMVAKHGGPDYPHYLRKHRSGAAGCAEHHSAEPSESWHRNADVHPDPQKGQDRLAAGHLYRGRCCHQRPWSVGVTRTPTHIGIRTLVICDSLKKEKRFGGLYYVQH